MIQEIILTIKNGRPVLQSSDGTCCTVPSPITYTIWDRTTYMITPTGKIFSPDEWIEYHGIKPYHKVICSANNPNGSFYSTIDVMIKEYDIPGIDFSSCKSDEDILRLIEAVEYLHQHSTWFNKNINI